MQIENKIQKIENQLFVVEEHNLTSVSPDAKYEAPKTIALYKSTGGAPIGEIGKNFNVTQPKALFDSFIDCVGNIKEFDLDNLDYQETKGGSKIRFRTKIANFGFKNGVGKVDDLDTFITLTTGYDGLTKTSLALESYRLICSNGMKIMGTSVNVAIKNTKGNNGKIQSLCNDVAKVIAQTQDINEYFKFLNTVDVSELQKQEVIKKSFGYNRQDEELSSRTLVNLEQIEESIALEFSRTGANMWGLLNGITHYTNHGGKEKKDKIDYIYQAGGARINEKAQLAIQELVKL